MFLDGFWWFFFSHYLISSISIRMKVLCTSESCDTCETSQYFGTCELFLTCKYFGTLGRRRSGRSTAGRPRGLPNLLQTYRILCSVLLSTAVNAICQILTIQVDDHWGKVQWIKSYLQCVERATSMTKTI